MIGSGSVAGNEAVRNAVVVAAGTAGNREAVADAIVSLLKLVLSLSTVATEQVAYGYIEFERAVLCLGETSSRGTPA